MNVLPVIQRELRVASRRRETWNLRLVFSGGTLLAFGFGMVVPHVGPEERGQVVLICLAVCGFVLSLLAGPYLTADVVSSEKREGTLGLLFLTPLNGWQIVLGKMVTPSLQVGYALLGIFTLFFLPLFLGGVVWSEVARIALTLLLTLLLSLACGIFWSTLVTEARTAVLATLITVLLFVFLPWLPGFLESLVTRRAPTIAGLPQLSPMTQMIFAFEENFRMARTPVLPIASGGFIYWGSVWCSLICSAGLAASRAGCCRASGGNQKPARGFPNRNGQRCSVKSSLSARESATQIHCFGWRSGESVNPCGSVGCAGSCFASSG